MSVLQDMLPGQYLRDASILGRGNKVFANLLKENCKQKKKDNVLIKAFEREALLKNRRASIVWLVWNGAELR